MSQLPMPSDLKGSGPGGTPASGPSLGPAPGGPPPEPPSVKLIVRLFLIPLLIVALAIGVMFLIGQLAGRTPTADEALERLRRPGGGRTAEWLVGPGAKQRYIDAKTLTDHMKQGMDESERIVLAGELIDILDNHTVAGEGQVRHFLLLALGRVWQIDPSQPAMDSTAARQSRGQTMDVMLRYIGDDELDTRKAAVAATAYWAGRDEVERAIPILTGILSDGREDIDVRLIIANVLGSIADEQDEQVIAVLNRALRDSNPRNAEIVWASALSLAQLNQPEVADTILMLLDRDELAELRYYDRETDRRNPQMRPLSDLEKQRILINTMIGVRNYNVPAVQEQLRNIARNDPSPRVQAAAREILATQVLPPDGP